MRNPKNKGSNFERIICKQLSLWISDNKNSNLLWRSSISGGRFTQGLKTNKNYKNQSGDICAIDEEGFKLTNLFSIECKHYRTLKFQDLIFEMKGNIFDFWGQTKKDAELTNKSPLLVAKANFHHPIIGFDKKTTRKIYWFIAKKIDILAIFPKSSLIIFNFNEFIDKIKFDDFEREVLKK